MPIDFNFSKRVENIKNITTDHAFYQCTRNRIVRKSIRFVCFVTIKCVDGYCYKTVWKQFLLTIYFFNCIESEFTTLTTLDNLTYEYRDQ
jgi:hypothetical protein